MKLAAALVGAGLLLSTTLAAASETRPPPSKSAWTWRRGASVGALGATYLAAWGGLSAVWWSSSGSCVR
jgi:hypothetical protein